MDRGESNRKEASKIPEDLNGDTPGVCKIIHLHEHEPVQPKPLTIEELLLALKEDHEQLLRTLTINPLDNS